MKMSNHAVIAVIAGHAAMVVVPAVVVRHSIVIALRGLAQRAPAVHVAMIAQVVTVPSLAVAMIVGHARCRMIAR